MIAMVLLSTALLSAVTTKVAILPLKAYDSSSKYIQKILTKRDLKLAFDKHAQYDLMDMKSVEKKFKQSGYRDAEALEIEEMSELAQSIDTDLLVIGNITSLNPVTFRVSMRFFSPRSKEIKSADFNVGKEKTARAKVLQDVMMVEIDRFVSTEVEKMYNIAANFYQNGNYTEAEKSLLNVIELAPNMKDAYFTLGSTYQKQKKYELAIANMNKTLELDPGNLQALYALTDIYEATAQPMKRIGVMSQIAEKTEDHEMWFNIGNLYAENSDVVNAEASFRKSIALEPTYGLARYRLAFLLYDEGKFNEAIEPLEIAFNEFPDNDLIARRLATSYQKAGRIDDAISKYETIMTNNPTNTSAYLNVVGLYRLKANDAGDSKVTAEMNQKAITAMTKLKGVDPTNAIADLNLASIYLSQNRNVDAEASANSALAKDPNLYLPYVILGTITQSKGTDSFNQFVDLEKQAAKAVGNKANQLKKQRDAAKANAAASFNRAKDQLNQALSRAQEAEARTDIQNRINRLNSLISQASGY